MPDHNCASEAVVDGAEYDPRTGVNKIKYRCTVCGNKWSVNNLRGHRIGYMQPLDSKSL